MSIDQYLVKWNLPSNTDTELAYFAGLFDGEGCIQLCRTTSRNWVSRPEGGVGLFVNLVNTCREPMELLRERFGGSVSQKIKSPGSPSKRRADYWLLSGKRAAHFLHSIHPFLRIKREQAEAVLVFAETYFNQWRHPKVRGWPLTNEAVHLRVIAYRAYRKAMLLGRPRIWAI